MSSFNWITRQPIQCITALQHTASMQQCTLSRRVVSTGGGGAGPASRSSSPPLLPPSSTSSTASAAAGAPLRGPVPRAPLPGKPPAEEGPRPWDAPAAARASERSGLSARGALGSSVCVNVRLPHTSTSAQVVLPKASHVAQCQRTRMRVHCLALHLDVQQSGSISRTSAMCTSCSVAHSSSGNPEAGYSAQALRV